MLEQDIQKRVTAIQFGLMSPEETKKGSVVHVIHPETIENGIPKENGLIDLRMGTTERNFLCQTCNSTSFECVGHYGHIELSKPMFHIGYIGKIKKTLESVCFYCSKIKVDKARLPPGLEAAWPLLKTKTHCEGADTPTGKTGCGNKQPVIKKDGLNLIAYMKENEEGEGKVVLNGERVYSILKKIPSDEFTFLGFDALYCRPEWMLLTIVVVPPPAVRPSIVLNGHLRAEDDLTHKLSDIVKSNGYLKKYEQEGAPSHIVRDYEQLLQFHLATLIDNEIGGQPQALQKSGRPLKSISARLKGKEGRVRGNLMGKRVDFSARSVISPDPNISVGQLGIPVQIARIHTFPERVNSLNIDFLQGLVDRGPNEHPGANYVIRTDGQRIDLKFNRQELKLEKGFVVERHLLEDDPVLFNRQPSLHKMSMMGHRARIMTGKSFRLNLSATGPYNADFDGDEMNLHMPQSYNTRAELMGLTAVAKQIVSPQSNKPVIGIVQDTLVGARLFTLRDTFFNRREAMAILFSFNSFAKRGESFSDFLLPTIVQPVELWTGKQLFSAILPAVFYSRETNGGAAVGDNADWASRNLTDSLVVIRRGRLLAGSIDKRSVGEQQGGLIHIVFGECGSETAQAFIDNIQRIVNYFLLHISSFSVGIGDCIADATTHALCRVTVTSAVEEVDSVISATKRNELEKMPGMNFIGTFESKVNAILNRARNVSGSLAQKSLNSQNNMKAMVVSGSKGSYINISQITTCLGQQNVEGKRIPFGFVERSLPHFCKYDFSARSRGFVKNSYISGMAPDEFFFHAMGGREGIIDTAIKTAETGYIQRRLVKALEDATVHHDYSVRNGYGDVYQFAYGDDTFDATHLESVTVTIPKDDIRVPLMKMEDQAGGRLPATSTNSPSIDDTRVPLMKMEDDTKGRLPATSTNSPSISSFRKMYCIDMFGLTQYAIAPQDVSPQVYRLLREDIDLQKALDAEYNRLRDGAHMFTASYTTPVNISRLVMRYPIRPVAETISPYRILQLLDEAMTGNPKLDLYIRLILNVKYVLLHLNLSNFMAILREVAMKILKARANANEMVGTLAAQSVGEPATQMTLNTFHLAGVASTVSMGVPRLNEIINLARNIKTPSMQIFLLGSRAGEANSHPSGSASILSGSSATGANSHGRASADTLGANSHPSGSASILAGSSASGANSHPSSSASIFTLPSIENARKIQNQIEYFSLRMACESSQIIYDPEIKSTVVTEDLLLVGTYFEMPDDDIDFSTLSKFLIRLVLARSVMVSKGLTLEFIASKIKRSYGSSVHIITSDENDEQMVIRLRFVAKGESLAFLGETHNEILRIHLRGFQGIKKAYLTDSAKEEAGGWFLQTDGINFAPILAASEIDGGRVLANDIHTIYAVLGVEAARQSILNELSLVIEGNGSYVNHRHMSLLADVMTVKGFLTGITRHGVNREAASVMKRASFEETVDVFLEAAVSSRLDTTRGVSENIMLGQLAPVGTGNVDLVLDTKKLELILPLNPVESPGFHSPSSLSTFSSYELGNSALANGNYSPISSLAYSPDAYSTGSYSPRSTGPDYRPVLTTYSPLSGQGSAHSGRYYGPSSTTYSPMSGRNTGLSSTTYSPTSTTYIPPIESTVNRVPGRNEAYNSYSPRPSPDSQGYRPNSPIYSPRTPTYEDTQKNNNDNSR